jgi:hypothetical protein
MLDKIYKLYKLIHPPEQNKPYIVNIDKCIEILKTIDNNFNYEKIDFESWKYISAQLPSNFFDYEKLDIVIHPFYERYHVGYKYQNMFSGDKKFVNYIIPNKLNENEAELHLYLKDLVYEIDSVTIFILLNILLMEKNKNNKDYMDTLVVCKDKMFDGCSKKKCNIFPLIHTILSKYPISNKNSKYSKLIKSSKSRKLKKTLKNTAQITIKDKKSTRKFVYINDKTKLLNLNDKTAIDYFINDICKNMDSRVQKIIHYNKLPRYSIKYETVNYTMCERKLQNNWDIWCNNINNIILGKEQEIYENGVSVTLSNNEKYDVHVIIGLRTTFRIMTKPYHKIKLDEKDELYDIIEKEKNKYKKYDVYLKQLPILKNRYPIDENISNILDAFHDNNVINLKYDVSTNCAGFLINLNDYLRELNKIKKMYDIVYEPIFDKLSVDKSRNTYILCIDNLFGMNSYYFTNSITNHFGDKLKSINSIGSCGGIANNINLGDIIMSRHINIWSNIIKSSIGKNIYENVENYLSPFRRMVEYNIDVNEQIKNIEKLEDLSNLIYDKLVHKGKSCTGSIIPLETDTLLNTLLKRNYIGIEMENYWIKKASKNINCLFMQYVSDLTLKQNYKLHEKNKYAEELFAVNTLNCLLRTVFAYINSQNKK